MSVRTSVARPAELTVTRMRAMPDVDAPRNPPFRVPLWHGRRMRLLAVALLACSQGPAPSTTPFIAPTPPVDASEVTDPAVIAAMIAEPVDAAVPDAPLGITTCPARLADAVGTCSTATCTYPEGTCRCAPEPHCGGAHLAPPERPEPHVFQCALTPPKVRPDGCPGIAPQPGTQCPTVGKACGYGGCSCSTSLTCGKRGWSKPQVSCKA